MEEKLEKKQDPLLAKLRKILRKGDKKSTAFAAEEALKFYKRSLDNLEKAPETPENLENKAETLLLLSEILFILGRWDAAIAYLEQVIDMGRTKAGLPRVGEAYRRAGNLWALKGDIDKTFESYNKALAVSRELKDRISVADSERGLGYACWRRGNIPDAEAHYNAAFKAMEGLNDEDLLAKTYLESGNVYNDKGDLNKAVDLYMKAIRVFRTTHDIYQEARGYNNLGDVCIKRRDWKKGIKYFEKTATLSESINDLHMQGWALFNAAECHSKGGDLDEAEACCTKALDMLSRIDDKIGIAYVFCNYGIVYRFKKEWAKSTKYFKFSLNIVKNLRTAGLEAYVLKEYAEMLLDWDKKDKAEELAILARNIYSAMGAKFYIEMMNELMARIKGKEYKMDLSLSQESLDAMDRESDEPVEPPVPLVQQPVVMSKDKKPEPLIGDDGPVNVQRRPTRPGSITMSPTVSKAHEPKAGPEPVPEPLPSIGPPEPIPEVEEVLSSEEEPKDKVLYLFLPKEEDEELRSKKVRFYVELPFAVPDIEVEEVREGERPDVSEDIRTYPSVKVFGKVFEGLPPVKQIIAEVRSRKREGRGPAPMRTLLPGGVKAKKPAASQGQEDTWHAGWPGAKPSTGPEAARPEHHKGHKKEPVHAQVAQAHKAKLHYSYLVEEDERNAFAAFKGLMNDGAKGLCVTRPPIRRIKDEFGIEAAEFLLLSTSDTPREGQHSSKDMEGLAKKLEAFMEKNDPSVILIDRSEVLISTAGFDEFVKLVHRLNEGLESFKCCVLVQMDPHALKEDEARSLRRELTKF